MFLEPTTKVFFSNAPLLSLTSACFGDPSSNSQNTLNLPAKLTFVSFKITALKPWSSDPPPTFLDSVRAVVPSCILLDYPSDLSCLHREKEINKCLRHESKLWVCVGKEWSCYPTRNIQIKSNLFFPRKGVPEPKLGYKQHAWPKWPMSFIPDGSDDFISSHWWKLSFTLWHDWLIGTKRKRGVQKMWAFVKLTTFDIKKGFSQFPSLHYAIFNHPPFLKR